MPEKQSLSSLAQSFDVAAPEYAEATSDLGNYIYERVANENLRLLLAGKRFKRALDAGGGIGKWIPFLSEYAETVDLVDISPKSVRIATDSLSTRYPNVTFSVADLERTSFPERVFDLVFSQGCILSYTPDPVRLLNELYRITAPGGFLWMDAYNCIGWALESPNPQGKLTFASVEKDLVFRMPDWDYPARMFRSGYLKELVESAGFSLLNEFGSVVLCNSFTFLQAFGTDYDLAVAQALVGLESAISRDFNSRGVGKNVAFFATRPGTI